MASNNINVGNESNDGKGQTLRDGFISVRKNIAEIFGITYTSDTQDLSGVEFSSDVVNEGATNKYLLTNSVTNEKMADDSVGAAELIDNSVGTEALNVAGNGDAGSVLKSDGDGSMSWINPADTLAEVLAIGNTTGGSDIAVSANDDITFTDSSEAIFGTGADLKIYHDGTNAKIVNSTGNLNVSGGNVNISGGNLQGTTGMFGTRLGIGFVGDQYFTGEDFLLRKASGGVNFKLQSVATGTEGTVTLSCTTDHNAIFSKGGQLDNDAKDLRFIVGASTKMTLSSTGTDISSPLTADAATFSGALTGTSATFGGNVILKSDSAFFNIKRADNTDLGYITDSSTWGDSGTDFSIGASSANLKFYTNNSTAIKLTIDSSGNVNIPAGNLGVGMTTAPSAKLDIIDTTSRGANEGSLTVEGRQDGSANVLTLRSRDYSDPSSAINANHGALMRWQGFDGNDFENMGYIFVGADGQTVANADAPSYMSFATSGDGSSTPTERLRIDSSGNSTFTGEVYLDNGKYLKFKRNSGGLSIETLGIEVGTDNVRLLTTGTFNLVNGSLNSMLYVKSGGDVGIGTTTPNEKLDVAGKVYIEGNGQDWNETTPGITRGSIHLDPGTLEDNTGNAITFGSSDAFAGENAYAGIYTRSDGNYGTKMYLATTNSYATGSKTRMMIDHNGNVGINVTDPDAQLEIVNSLGGSTRLGYSGGSDSYFDSENFYVRSGNGNTNKFIINSSGKVGIGTTTPDNISSSGTVLSISTPGGLTTNSLAGSLTFITNDTSFTSTYADGVTTEISSISESSTGAAYGLAFSTSTTTASNRAERMRISSTGDVAIGDVAGTKLSIAGAVGTTNGTAALPTHTFYSDSNTGMFRAAADTLAFSTAGVHRMRITSGGTFLVNQESASSNANGFGVYPAGSNGGTLVNCYNGNDGVALRAGRNSNGILMLMVRGSTSVGSISVTETSTSYAISSDYRLKEDLQDFNGLDMISKIPVYDFKWKVNDSRSYGVMAHELQEVLPQAVVGEKDAVEDYEITPAVLDEEGNVSEEAVMGTRDDTQGVDYSKIVPLLVKSIQELKAEIELLKLNN